MVVSSVSADISSISIQSSKKVFLLINDTNYDGGREDATIFFCYIEDLSNLGLDDNEIKKVDSIKVGEQYKDEFYNSIVQRII